MVNTKSIGKWAIFIAKALILFSAKGATQEIVHPLPKTAILQFEEIGEYIPKTSNLVVHMAHDVCRFDDKIQEILEATSKFFTFLFLKMAQNPYFIYLFF